MTESHAGFDLAALRTNARRRGGRLHAGDRCGRYRFMADKLVVLDDHLDPSLWCEHCSALERDAITVWLNHRPASGFGIVAGNIPPSDDIVELGLVWRALADTTHLPVCTPRVVTAVPEHVGRFAVEFAGRFFSEVPVAYLPAGGPDLQAAARELATTCASLWDADPDADVHAVIERTADLAELAAARHVADEGLVRPAELRAAPRTSSSGTGGPVHFAALRSPAVVGAS